MLVEHVHEKIRYTLSNENLKKGDKVFPIAWGRCLDKGGWILHDFDFREIMSGFPNKPHIIEDLNYSDYKPYQVRTNNGYSPIECYYKIIKTEIQVKVQESIFGGRHEWQEVDLTKSR